MEDMNQISQAIVDGKLELAQELVGRPPYFSRH